MRMIPYTCMKLSAISPEAEAYYRKAEQYAHQYYTDEIDDFAPAEEYYQKAAEAGHPAACYRIALNYRGDKDDRWLHYLIKSAELGYPDAMMWLAEVYENGISAEKNTEASLKWYKQAALAGNYLAGFAEASLRYDSTGTGAEELAALLQELAAKGNANSLYDLALMYLRGIGVPRDTKQAIHLATEAAKRSHTAAAILLAEYYDKEEQNKAKSTLFYAIAAGTERLTEYTTWDFTSYRRPDLAPGDNISTREALERAAALDHPESLRVLGHHYFEDNKLEAMVECFTKAAQLGSIQAITDLGWAYFWGKGVQRNHRKCVKLFRKAAKEGNALAMYNLGYRLLNGEGVRKNTDEGMKWLHRALRAGDTYAIAALGHIYLEGKNGIAPNPKKALYYLRRGVREGDSASLNNLGLAYYEGTGVKRNYAKALYYYTWAETVDSDNECAIFNQGVCHLLGHGTKPDYNQALEKFRQAANMDYDSAQWRMGYCHEFGYGTPINLQEAITWYKRAADQGHPQARKALRRLQAPLPAHSIPKYEQLFTHAREHQTEPELLAIGLLYEQGHDTRRNLRRARQWYTAAALNGSQEALAALKRITREPDKERL